MLTRFFYLSLLVLTLTISGCSLWQKQDVLKNRQYDYLQAENHSALELPENLQLQGAVAYAPIPPARRDTPLTKAEVETLLAPPQIDLSRDTTTPPAEPSENAGEQAEDRIAESLDADMTPGMSQP